MLQVQPAPKTRKVPEPDPCDHIGQYIGQVRRYEHITQDQLSHGLCTRSFLSRIENGSREVEPMLAVALLQRLGRPAEMFIHILSCEEFQRWQRRLEIFALLRRGKAEPAEAAIAAYRDSACNVLDLQFTWTAELNRLALLDTPAEKLRVLAREALELTCSGFAEKTPEQYLFSRNEGCLLLAFLELTERLEGVAAVEDQYRALLCSLKAPRFEKRQRVYLLPYAACHVLEAEYRKGRYAEALAVCEEALTELTAEKRLFAYDQLLEWKQTLLNAMGSQDRTAGMLLERLRLIRTQTPGPVSLLAPYEEQMLSLCLNDVIRTRRILLGHTQEELSADICDTGTISHIETQKSVPQKSIRRSLLKKVGMSGEHYDYEIISSRYEDYLLRSEIGRAINSRDFDKAQTLLERLCRDLPNNATNSQYIWYVGNCIHGAIPEGNPGHFSLNRQKEEAARALRLTMPLFDLEQIGVYPSGILTVNEIMHLIVYGSCCKRLGQSDEALAIFSYIKECLERMAISVVCPGSLYANVVQKVASILGDMGRFGESSRLCRASIQRILESHDSTLLAMLLYNIAWNFEQQSSQETGTGPAWGREQARALFQQAYAAALISGDMVGQQHILTHCSRIYGNDFSEEVKSG